MDLGIVQVLMASIIDGCGNSLTTDRMTQIVHFLSSKNTLVSGGSQVVMLENL
jgi:hypothetical protein